MKEFRFSKNNQTTHIKFTFCVLLSKNILEIVFSFVKANILITNHTQTIFFFTFSRKSG